MPVQGGGNGMGHGGSAVAAAPGCPRVDRRDPALTPCPGVGLAWWAGWCQAGQVTDSNADPHLPPGLPPRGSALFRPRKPRVPGSFTHQELVADLAAQARARRVMAERMAKDLAFPPHRRPGELSEYVRAKSMYVKYESTPEADGAFEDAPRLLALSGHGSAGYFEGPGGLVVYIHGTYELWNLVVPIKPFRDFVLLGVEDVEDVFFLLTSDSGEAVSALSTLEEEVNAALPHRADMAERGLMPPLHQGYSAASSSARPGSSDSPTSDSSAS